MVLFSFLNFFAIFLEFSITCRVRTEQNDNFYFFSFLAFSNLFWLEMKPKWYILIFWIFLLLFWNFELRVRWERNGTIIFIFYLSHLFQTYFGLKRIHNGIFLIFLQFFCNFLLRVVLERNVMVIFIFPLSHPFPTYFGLKWSHIGIF